MSRATECFSMYSDMSMRTIALSSSNRKDASALVSSVLPTPVGPKNMNEPIGRFGSCRPARARRTAVETAMHRFVLADDAAHDLLLHLEEFFALAFEHLVDRNAGPARDDLRDVVRGHRLVDQHAVALALRLLKLLLKRRGSCRK